MHILLKGYYGFKNFGDELILLPLLTWLEEQYQPDEIDILCGDPQWLEQWVLQHKYFMPPLFHKLHFLPKPNLIEQIKMFFGNYQKKYDLIIFGGGEVLDESRKFPHDGRNIPLLYRNYVSNNKFILLGGFGEHKKHRTKVLHQMLFDQAQFIGARDVRSMKQAQFYVKDNEKKKIKLFGDFCLSLLEEVQEIFKQENIENTKGKYVLINLGDTCCDQKSFNNIKLFLEKFKNTQPIYVPMNLEEENKYFEVLQEQIPNLEKFDWSTAGVSATLKLFYFAQGGIGTKLHFLYPLKYFGKPVEVLDYRYKIETNFADLDHLDEIKESYQSEAYEKFFEDLSHSCE